jgi:predicted acylesterase/phospholipase RssA
MTGINKGRTIVASIAAILVMFTMSVPAESKSKSKCEGNKKQRKQKMEPRTIDMEQLEAMLKTYAQDRAADRERMAQTAFNRIDREYQQHLATGADFTYDVLVISGGGAKGAFGSGFLEGWGTVMDGPFARPEFDMVTGVSTGSLIAPFAFVGTTESYETIVQFYENPESNWVKKRGLLYFKPHHASLFNDCHLQETIRGAIDEPLVEGLIAGSAEDRLLLIGTTNLDAGKGRIFNLGHEAKAAAEGGAGERVGTILIASAAIPAVFPPVDIDGMLYADGGATSNLFVTGISGPDGPFARFRKRHPDAPLPKVRVWVQVNEMFQPEPAVTQPTWVSVAGRALDTLTSTDELFALTLIKKMVHEAKVERGIDVEFRMVAIPTDAPKNESGEMFDQDYMRALEDLGHQMGADPKSWTDVIPSAY